MMRGPLRGGPLKISTKQEGLRGRPRFPVSTYEVQVRRMIHLSLCIYIYIYIYIHMQYLYLYIYIYIYTYTNNAYIYVYM